MFPIPVNIYFIIFSFLVSLFCYPSIKHRALAWFIPFLLLMISVELTGRYIRTGLHLANSWLYNIFIPVEYLFYTYLFYRYFEDKVFKKIAKTIMVLIPVAAVINIVFIQGFYSFNTNTLLAGNCIMICFCLLFFTDLFKREEEMVLLTSPMFWITTGVLLFNLGELSYNLFFDYILKNRHDPKAMVFTAINGKLVYVLYTMISIGLLCTKKWMARRYHPM